MRAPEITGPHRLIPPEPMGTYADYRAATGEDAVARARDRTAKQILLALAESKLRGRGGAGFPTADKWRTVAQGEGGERFVVCNAAEGEPGTFKDRYLLRRNPYATLEGMLIAAHVVRAKRLYVATKAAYRPEIRRLTEAIIEMSQAGLFEGLDITLVEGPDEYLYGEEKALLNVIEGNGPFPKEAHYPPYASGLFASVRQAHPTVVNNVETFAHVPGIIRHGAVSFRQNGTEDTAGTLLFTLSGALERPGVVEAPAGITLRELFSTLGGGARAGRTLTGALPGVASAFIDASDFGTPAEFGALEAIGSGLGSCGFIVIDDSVDLRRVAQSVARFLYVESCTQCPACKVGLRGASHTLDILCGDRQPPNTEGGRSAADRVADAATAARRAPQGNRCYLPVQGSIVIPSLLDHAELAGEVGPPVPIPKLSEYDPDRQRFDLDSAQERKLADWTYAPEVRATSSASQRDEAPPSEYVSLGPDVDKFVAYLDRQRRRLPRD